MASPRPPGPQIVGVVAGGAGPAIACENSFGSTHLCRRRAGAPHAGKPRPRPSPFWNDGFTVTSQNRPAAHLQNSSVIRSRRSGNSGWPKFTAQFSKSRRALTVLAIFGIGYANRVLLRESDAFQTSRHIGGQSCPRSAPAVRSFCLPLEFELPNFSITATKATPVAAPLLLTEPVRNQKGGDRRGRRLTPR